MCSQKVVNVMIKKYKDLVRLMILSLSASWQKSGLLQAPPIDLTIEKIFSTESERS